MLNQYTLKMPKVVYSGENALGHIAEIIKNDIQKIVIFSDKGIIGAGLLEGPLSYVKASGVPYEILDELPIEPSCDEAQAVVDQFKKIDADFIIAVGGGSVMDIAKLASVLKTDAYTVRDLLDNPQLAEKCVQTLMIPTTAGTGSEATPNSIVLVPEKALKVGIVNEAMIADYVILDAMMIKKLPRKIAAATGVDALAHAIECYTSNKANPFSDTFALEALYLLFNHLEKACDDQEAMASKNAMMIASFYGGVAITASGTTAVHALSYPLGGKYHIPHGISNAMLLVPVMKFNEPMSRSRFATIYDRLHDDGANKTEEEKSAWLINRLDDMVKHLDIPTKLIGYNVPKDDLELLVAAGMAVTRLLDNNIRKVTADDARALYLQLL